MKFSIKNFFRKCKKVRRKLQNCHCMKSVQIRSFFWSVFYRIHPEYGKIWTTKNSVFGQLSRSLFTFTTEIFNGKFHFFVQWMPTRQSLLVYFTQLVISRFFKEIFFWKLDFCAVYVQRILPREIF